MRLESNRDGSMKVWLTEPEYEVLVDSADEQAALAMAYGAEVGLRVSEIAAVTRGAHRETAVDVSAVPGAGVPDNATGTVKVTWLAVYGKDTSGERDGGKRRDALVPDSLATSARLYQLEAGINDDEPLFDVTPRTIRSWITDAGVTAATSTGNDDYRKVSPHDLRRYFATRMLQVHGLNPEVVMEVGGWDSYQALRPYLQSPVEEVIAAEYAANGLL